MAGHRETILGMAGEDTLTAEMIKDIDAGSVEALGVATLALLRQAELGMSDPGQPRTTDTFNRVRMLRDMAEGLPRTIIDG